MARNGKNISAFGVDVQNDFCVPNGELGYRTGQLLVPGAYDAAKRTAKFVKATTRIVNQWWWSLDMHHHFDVGHAIFWKDKNGRHPQMGPTNPAMPISVSQIEKREWIPSRPELYDRMLEYAKALEQNGQYCTMVWNTHCLLGDPGSAFVPEVAAAIHDWEHECRANSVVVIKGTNPLTEHYSALEAEVPDPNDPTTHLQSEMIKTMQESDEIWWLGQALDFCVISTMKTAFKVFDKDTLKRNIIFSDLTNPIFPDKGKQILKDLENMGVKVTTTKDYLAV